MNKLIIIGNLTADPVQRTTQTGKTVTTFTVAVNRRGEGKEADFFRASAWGELGENCQKYLAKGRKAAVEGSVSASAYQGQDGKLRASLEVRAQNVWFLSPKEGGSAQTGDNVPSDYQQVYTEDLPF